MNTLYLDTTRNTEIIVRLSVGEEVFEEKIAIYNNRTQVVLPTIQKILKAHNLTIYDIKKVEVNPGPGSFTGVRVGAAIANALIFGLGLSEKLIEPVYS